MERQNIYFYPNQVVVQVNTDPTIISRWADMYERTVKVYHGVDNTIQFLFRNSDQQRVNVTGWLITFNMISDTENALVVSKPATVIDAPNGLVTVILTEFDLIGLKNSAYNYALTVTDPNGIEQVVYAAENYEVRGTIIVQAGPYPKVKPSIMVDIPTSSNSAIYTSALTADRNSMQQSSRHTAQFYFNNFTGNLEIQATLDTVPTSGNVGGSSLSWGTISNLQYVNQMTTDYYTFDGVFSAVRFVVKPTDGNVTPSPVTKILYRA
jgi:hypothetical protein